MACIKIRETVMNSAATSTVVAPECVNLGRSHVRSGGTVDSFANVRRYQRWCSKKGTRTIVVAMMPLIVAILLSYISEPSAQSSR